MEKGYIVASPIPGKRREQNIVFTDAGKEFAQEYLSIIYQVERLAMAKTIERYSDSFIEAMECYAACLEEAFRGAANDERKDK